MRRHGEVPAGKGRRDGENSSPTEQRGAEISGLDELQSSQFMPDNVFSLFPPGTHRKSPFSPPRIPPDALASPAKPQKSVVSPDGRTAGRTGDKQRRGEKHQPVRTQGSTAGQRATQAKQPQTPTLPTPAPPSAQAPEPPAWTQHPITKALEALNRPGSTPSPTQIIAESLRGRTGGWMPVRPLPPEVPEAYQPPQTHLPQPHLPEPRAPHYGDAPAPPDLPVEEAPFPEPATQETPGHEALGEEALGEEAAIAAEAKLAAEQHFWELWLTHQDQLRKQCMHMMSGNLADAEDALSSAMLRASQKFIEYSGSIMNEKAWLSKLVHNVCIDQYRQRRRTYYQSLEGEATEQIEEAMFSGPQPSPEEVALGREQVATLETCLEKLSNNLRVPLMLRCVEGWSYPDIAEELDLRADTVRKRVQLARDFLRGRDIR